MTQKNPDASNIAGERDPDPDLVRSNHEDAFDRQLIAAMVGHELREPLNAIISFLNVTVQERLGPLNELQMEFLNSADTAARRLERRVEDVQVALLEGDAFKLQRTWINLNQRVHATCRELAWAAEKYEINLLMALEQSIRNPGVWADPDRLDQVLINLIENAIRYAPMGTEVSVRTSFKENGYWTFTVENVAEADHLPINPAVWFQARERSSRSNDPNRPGLGLGLTIARYIVHAHGGEIWANINDSRVQIGFSIPHHKSAAQNANPARYLV